MKKISIYPAVLKCKPLSDGSMKIRVAVSHNNETRYIITRLVIPSVKNFRNGEVCGIPAASSMNRKLRTIVSEYYDLYDKIPNAEVLSAKQIVDILKDGGVASKTTLEEIGQELILNKEASMKDNTRKIYESGLASAVAFFGERYALAALTPLAVTRYHTHLKRDKKNNCTTINFRISILRRIVTFAKRRGYVEYKIDPFIDFVMPRSNKRDVALSVEELRKLRDAKIENKAIRDARDYFLLSFYLCGMNCVDMVELDITKDVVRYKRKKTDGRRKDNEWTMFTLQHEARAIMDRSIDKQRILLRKIQPTSIALGTFLYRSLDTLRKLVIPERDRLIYYSARKTFAQLAAEIGTPDNVIEYCLGDSQGTSVISYYRKVNQKMADRYIRKVFDFVASDKTIEEWLEEK